MRVSAAKYDILETDEYQSSPVVAVYATRQPIRRQIAEGTCPDDFPILHELRAEGATDYVAFPLHSPTVRSTSRPIRRGNPAASRRSSSPTSNRPSRR